MSQAYGRLVRLDRMVDQLNKSIDVVVAHSCGRGQMIMIGNYD